MIKAFLKTCPCVLFVLCFLLTSMLLIGPQAAYGQSTIPSSMANHPMGGLSRILNAPNNTGIVPLSFQYISPIKWMSSGQLATVEYQRVPRDTETIRNQAKRKEDLLNQIIVAGSAGFLGGILALRGTNHPAIPLGVGVSLGALSSIPFYMESDQPIRFVLYGSGAGGLAAGLLTLFTQF